jgi:hypothetical protein
MAAVLPVSLKLHGARGTPEEHTVREVSRSADDFGAFLGGLAAQKIVGELRVPSVKGVGKRSLSTHLFTLAKSKSTRWQPHPEGEGKQHKGVRAPVSQLRP